MKPVYCIQCQFYQSNNCVYPDNKKYEAQPASWRAPAMETFEGYKRHPSVINKKNDCPWYHDAWDGVGVEG